MLMEFLLDIDSSERDTLVYPEPNDYVINLNRQLYNVTNLKLEAARIPTSQLHINQGNRTFSIDGTTITLPERNFDDGNDLKSNLIDQIVTPGLTNVQTITFDSNTNALTFSNTLGNNFSLEFYDGSNGSNTNSTYGTPFSLLGFNQNNQTSSSGTLVSGSIDLDGPTSLIIRVTTNGDDLNKEVYVNGGSFSFGTFGSTQGGPGTVESIYMGRIMTGGHNQLIDYNGNDDPVTHFFHKGPEKSISQLRIRFYYNVGSKLIPYDFRSRNHTLKFRVTCSLDKLSSLAVEKPIVQELPPPVELPFLEPPSRDNRYFMLLVGLGLILGLIILMFKR